MRDGDSAFVAGYGQLQFKDVSFSYDNTRPVLKNINFTIKPGQKVALVVRIIRAPVFVSVDLVAILGVGAVDFLSLKVFSQTKADTFLITRGHLDLENPQSSSLSFVRTTPLQDPLT